MQILVVDDDTLAGAITAAILESAGYEPLMAENGIEALEKLAEVPGIGLILSDMNMPFISGMELFQTLRSQGMETPFILLSGDALAPGDLNAAAPDACLLKDFDIKKQLLEAVESVLARRRT